MFTPSWDEPDYMGLTNSTDPVPFFNLYRNCVHYTDQLIGTVLESMEQAGLLENSVIIIIGDHGQEFNENGKNYWGHGSNFTRWQTEVPFILYYPGVEAGSHFSHMTTHYDVVPTVMSRFLGTRNDPSTYSMGYDLYDTRSRYPHIVGDHIDYGFVFEDIIVRTNHMGTMEVTDRSLNPLRRDALDVHILRKAIEKRNRFYNTPK